MPDPRPVTLREQAARDVDEAIDWLREQAGPATALAFVDALQAAFAHVAEFPASGSPRYATELDVPGLRAWPISGYQHLLLYVDRGEHVDVLRVLHGRRDIPAWLRANESS